MKEKTVILDSDSSGKVIPIPLAFPKCCDKIFITVSSTGLTPTGTDFVFNADTQITASSKSESDGVDGLYVWLVIQEI